MSFAWDSGDEIHLGVVREAVGTRKCAVAAGGRQPFGVEPNWEWIGWEGCTNRIWGMPAFRMEELEMTIGVTAAVLSNTSKVQDMFDSDYILENLPALVSYYLLRTLKVTLYMNPVISHLPH